MDVSVESRKLVSDVPTGHVENDPIWRALIAGSANPEEQAFAARWIAELTRGQDRRAHWPAPNATADGGSQSASS